MGALLNSCEDARDFAVRLERVARRNLPAFERKRSREKEKVGKEILNDRFLAV